MLVSVLAIIRRFVEIDGKGCPRLYPANTPGRGRSGEWFCLFFAGVEHRETDLSTFQARPQTPARVPRPHGDGRWPQGDRQPPRQGARQALRLIARLARRPR